MSGGSQPAQAVNDILSQYEAKLTQVNSKAVGIQALLMFGVSILTVLAFSALRPTNRVVYAPKLDLPEVKDRLPPLKNGFLSWISPLRHATEDQLLVAVGLDAVTYLRFLRMLSQLFLVVAILTCAVLLPLNLVYNIKNVPSGARNVLGMLTIANVRGDILYVHVAMTYIITIIACAFIWMNYGTMVELRWRYFSTPEFQNALHNRSLMITQVPKDFRSDEGLQALFNSLQAPYPTTSVHIGRRVGQLPALIEMHNQAVRELEQILTTYLKNPNKLPAKRPTIRVGGFLGCCGGQVVDAIDYYEAKVKRIEGAIEIARNEITSKKAENYGFASMGKVTSAHIVAKKVEGKKTKKATIELAPHPTDIIWENLLMTHGQRSRATFFGGLILIVVCVFYCIPLLGVSFLANLAAVTQYVKFIDTWSNDSQETFAAFTGIVPPLLSLLLQLLLPYFMRSVGKMQGAITHSKLDRGVVARYFAFLFITQLVFFSLIGVGFTLIAEVIADIGQKKSFTEIMKEFTKLPDRVQNTYISQSNYWLTWFPLRGFSAVFDLAQIINLIWIRFKTSVFGRTPRDIQEWTKPPEFDFPVYFCSALLMAAVAFIYAPLAPLVSVFAAIAFWASWVTSKYFLMFVAVTRVETGGRMWRVVINRTLFCMIAMQLLVILTIGLQRGWINSISAVPPIIGIIAFKVVLKSHFDDRFEWFIPQGKEADAIPDHRSDERKHRLERRFGHPALTQQLFNPIVHQKAQHLLSEVFSSGRLQRAQTQQWNGHDLKTEITPSGMVIAVADDHNLAYDHAAILAQEDMWETGSMASTAFTPPINGPRTSRGGYFELQKQQYLAHGPGFSRGGTPGTPGDIGRVYEDIELMQTTQSREHLLRNTVPYGHHPAPSQSSLGHHTNPSQSSMDLANQFGGSPYQNPPPQYPHSRTGSQSGYSGPPRY